MKKKFFAVLMILAVAVAFMPTSAFAGSKVKSTVYNQVIKKGNTVYCAGAGDSIYKVKVKNGKVVSAKNLIKNPWAMGDYSYVDNMKKKGKYLYYVHWSEGTYCSLMRTNVNSGKTKVLAKMAGRYAIKKNKLYAEIWNVENDRTKTKVMKLNGKKKKKTSKKVVMKSRNSNARGYSVKYKEHEAYDSYYRDYYVDSVSTYLKTPKGTFFLGKIKTD